VERLIIAIEYTHWLYRQSRMWESTFRCKPAIICKKLALGQFIDMKY